MPTCSSTISEIRSIGHCLSSTQYFEVLRTTVISEPTTVTCSYKLYLILEVRRRKGNGLKSSESKDIFPLVTGLWYHEKRYRYFGLLCELSRIPPSVLEVRYDPLAIFSS
jgi:hypothetical protein